MHASCQGPSGQAQPASDRLEADSNCAPPDGSEHPLDSRAQEVIEAAVTASRALVALAARSLADCEQDVTLPQYRLLVVLATRGPQPLTSIAAALSVSPPTASRMCDRLVRKRLISRRVHARDRRQVQLRLTPLGSDLVDTVTAHRRREMAILLERLPSERYPALIEAFLLFAEAAGELAQTDWAAGWEL